MAQHQEAEPEVIESTTKHTHTIILLHGRGSNAQEFREDFIESHATNGRSLVELFPSFKWVLPSAPIRFSTVFQEELTEWFDVYSLTDPEQRQDLQRNGLRCSLRRIARIVTEEAELVPADHIFLGGISQGCAVAALAMLCMDLPWAGFVGVAGWLPLASQIDALTAAEKDSELAIEREHVSGLILSSLGMAGWQPVSPDRPAQDRTLSVMLCHGLDDGVVDVSLGRQLCSTLCSLGLDVEWTEYDDCGHWVKDPEGLNAIAHFLARQSQKSEEAAGGYSAAMDQMSPSTGLEQG